MVVVDTRDHILSTFDRALSMYADEQFARQGIDVIHNSRVRSQVMPFDGAEQQLSLLNNCSCWRCALSIADAGHF